MRKFPLRKRDNIYDSQESRNRKKTPPEEELARRDNFSTRVNKISRRLRLLASPSSFFSRVLIITINRAAVATDFTNIYYTYYAIHSTLYNLPSIVFAKKKKSINDVIVRAFTRIVAEIIAIVKRK